LPSFSRVHPVAFPAAAMFDLVADVEKYPEFVPLCEHLTVRSRREREGRELLVAEMGIGYKAIRETFTTQVMLNRPDLAIEVRYLDGPFKRLENRWNFVATGPSACDVHFFIDYEFSSRILGALMGAVFDAAFRRFTSAFEERAKAVHGAQKKESPAG